MTSTTRTSEQHSDALRRANGAMADRLFKGAAYGSGLLILGLLAAVAVFLLMRAWPVVAGPRDATQAVIASFTGGRFDSFVQYVGPLLFGSVLVAALALAIAFFVSIGFPSFYRELTTGTRAMQATPGCTYSLQVVESSGKHPLKALRHKAFMEQDGNTGEPAVSFKGKT